MKKLFIPVLVFGLIGATLLGCSGGENQEVTDEGKVKLTAIMTKHPLTKSFAEMNWLKEAEDRAGIDIEWEEVTADWGQKKSPMLASGDIPDLIVGPNAVTDAEFAQFPGLFEDLSQHLDQLPNVQTMFEEHPETKALATQPDGKIYGLPKYQRFWPETATRQFINKQWLDNLGLNVPTTWEELHEVLLAFKNEDANGNGDPNDEIPVDWAPVGTGGFGFFQPTVLLGSLGITIEAGGGQGYFVEDGKVKNFFVDERYRTWVQFLNRLYRDGLVNPEVFTQDYTKYQSLGRGDGQFAKVGYTYGWELTDRFGSELAGQYIVLPPLKVSADADYELSWSYDYYHLNYGVNMIQLSSQTKHKEAALKFINELYDPVVSMQILFGDLGTHIEDHGNGTYTVLPPEDPSMDPGTWKWTSTWADNGPMYISDSLQLTLGSDMQSIDEQTEPNKDVLASIDKDNDLLYGMFLKYSVEDNRTLSNNHTVLMNLAMSKFAQWVTEGGIEAEWEAFVGQMFQQGLQQNLDIIQRYYDAYKAGSE